MSAEHSSDVLPILSDAHHGFDPALRGYDRAQVDQYLSQLEDEVRSAVADRDRAATRTADLAAQLASAQAQIESLRRQLRAAAETVTPENVDVRVRQAMESAQTEAARIRGEAETQAEAVRNGASDGAARTRAAAHAEAERIVAEATARLAAADETFRRRVEEAQQHRDRVEQDLAESLARVRSEEAALTAQAEAERNRLNAEAEAERSRLEVASAERRALADEDFEITLRERRTRESEEIATERAAAHAEAERTISDATKRAGTLVEDATAEVRRLHAHRDETHAALHSLHGKLGDALNQSLAETPPAP